MKKLLIFIVIFSMSISYVISKPKVKLDCKNKRSSQVLLKLSKRAAAALKRANWKCGKALKRNKPSSKACIKADARLQKALSALKSFVNEPITCISTAVAPAKSAGSCLKVKYGIKSCLDNMSERACGMEEGTYKKKGCSSLGYKKCDGNLYFKSKYACDGYKEK
jgi:hypothetical protein